MFLYMHQKHGADVHFELILFKSDNVQMLEHNMMIWNLIRVTYHICFIKWYIYLHERLKFYGFHVGIIYQSHGSIWVCVIYPCCKCASHHWTPLAWLQPPFGTHFSRALKTTFDMLHTTSHLTAFTPPSHEGFGELEDFLDFISG